MKKIMSIIFSVMLASFVSTGVYAAGADEHTKKMDDKAHSESVKPMDESYGERSMGGAFEDTTHWIGKNVRNFEGEKLGTVKDFIRDNEGNISLAVISHGGFLGIGEDRVAVPYTMLTFNEEEGHFVADLTEDQLAGAPTVDQDADLSERVFAEEVYRYFGERPYWTDEGAASEPGMEFESEFDFESDTMREDMGSGESSGMEGMRH